MSRRSIRALVKEITYRPRNRVELFLQLDLVQQASVLMRLSKHVQGQLLAELKNEVVSSIFDHLDPDDITDVLQSVSPKRQKELLEGISKELQEKVGLLLQFDPKTAAGLMSLNYIQVEETMRLTEVMVDIRTHESRTGKLPVVLVLRKGILQGVLSIEDLLMAQPQDRAGNYVKEIVSLNPTASSESVINTFLDNPHQKIVVLSEKDAILGVLYSDDVLRVMQASRGSSLYDFAGVSNEETVFGTVREKVRFRYKWLIINLGTAFLASFVVSRFDEVISEFVLLAVYMPIVAGMGGNAATQTLAVLVRGIAMKQIELSTAWVTLRREISAAMINGFINGLLVAGVVLLFNRDVKMAFVLAMAMVVNLMVAGFFGTLVPLVMVKLKKDPAASATVFITTATDVLGFLAFLGLASVVLR